jgi:tetratricopeptide (TPR) repeat protein
VVRPAGSAALAQRALLGARVRELRLAAGLTQTELAAGRFSKEYVSQVERGRTRPSTQTLEWLATRLGTDSTFLEEGVSEHDRKRLDAALAEADALLASNRYDAAIGAYRAAASLAAGAKARASELRALNGQAWAQLQLGRVDDALKLLEDAQRLTREDGFNDLDRAEVLYRVAVCRYSSSTVADAVRMFDEALRLAESSGFPCDRLRADIFQWRSRCFRRARDWEAASEDIERSLELAEGRSDRRQAAGAFFQAALVAERQGRWVLARSHTENALELLTELGDAQAVARTMNNLAGLNHLLGSSGRAIELLRQAFESFVDLGLAAEAGYTLCSLAEVHFDTGDFDRTETEARKALELLAGRDDHVAEIGTAQLVLGRALLEQDRLLEGEELIAAAEASFQEAESVGHQAAAWIARGDVADRVGDSHEAARLYRQAAVALQDPPA